MSYVVSGNEAKNLATRVDDGQMTKSHGSKQVEHLREWGVCRHHVRARMHVGGDVQNITGVELSEIDFEDVLEVGIIFVHFFLGQHRLTVSPVMLRVGDVLVKEGGQLGSQYHAV